MAVGSKLKQIIIESGYTQKEVADMAGIKPQTLNNIIIRDSARADIQILLKICKVLNIDVSIFADDALEEFYQENSKAKKENNQEISLTTHEIQIIREYRNNPSMQDAVDRLLNISNETKVHTVYRAARSENNAEDEILQVSEERIKKLREAPELDEEL